jgi:hypothetical protein
LATSTRKQYDRIIRKFVVFCGLNVDEPPPKEVSIVANFLANQTSRSNRPKSGINITLAALQCFYSIYALGFLLHDDLITRLVQGIVKGGTVQPRLKTPVMPVGPFIDLFISWSNNEQLVLSKLRLKCITLMVLVAMLRPSDIAPRGEDMVLRSVLFSLQDVSFLLNVVIHRNKNDYERDGFHMNIPKASCDAINP